MTIFLTICSANYLAQAKTLADSVREYHPAARTAIGLVDKVPPTLLPSYWDPHELLPVEELAIPAFATMVAKYNLVELNTAVKPFYIEHLYRRDADVSEVIYLDPDILVLGSFDRLIAHLADALLVVTPHSVTTSDSPESVSIELSMLLTGVYNLGFLATSRKPRVFDFLRWWQHRLEHYCFYRPYSGLFVDQIWMVLAPHFFGNVYVETGLGYNVCYWNLYERTITREGSQFLVGGHIPLTFYHFSSYDPRRPEIMVGRDNAPFPAMPDLQGLFDAYRARLMENGFETTSKAPCAFAVLPSRDIRELKTLPRAKRALLATIRQMLRFLPGKLRGLLRRMGRFLMDNCADASTIRDDRAKGKR